MNTQEQCKEGTESKENRSPPPERDRGTQGEWQTVDRRRAKNQRRRNPTNTPKQKQMWPSLVIRGIAKPRENRDTFCLQRKLAELELDMRDAFVQPQGSVRLLFETEQKKTAALEQLQTEEKQAKLLESFGKDASVERGRSPHRIAFLRVPQRDSREGFKASLEREGFTVEHIEYRGHQERHTHTRIVTVKEGDKAKAAIEKGEVRLGFLVRYRVGSAHAPPPVQRFRCQNFQCHSNSCTNAQRCRKCAGPHRSSECTAPASVRRCANCGGPHAASAFVCPKRPLTVQQKQQQAQRAQYARTQPQARPSSRHSQSQQHQSQQRSWARIADPHTLQARTSEQRKQPKHVQTEPTHMHACQSHSPPPTKSLSLIHI